MAEFEKPNIPADGWFASLQTQIAGQVLRGAPSYLARTDKVRKLPSESCF